MKDGMGRRLRDGPLQILAWALLACLLFPALLACLLVWPPSKRSGQPGSW